MYERFCEMGVSCDVIYGTGQEDIGRGIEVPGMALEASV
jgi:hypothetical protein